MISTATPVGKQFPEAHLYSFGNFSFQCWMGINYACFPGASRAPNTQSGSSITCHLKARKLRIKSE